MGVSGNLGTGGGSGAVDAVNGQSGTVVLTLDGIAAAEPTANDVDINGHELIGVADPTAAQHAATKAYADAGDATKFDTRGAGIGGAGTTILVTYGTAANTAAQGNDARLSDARTPTAHHTSHDTGGGDAIAALAGSVITSGTVAAARLPTLDAITAPAADVSLNSHKATNVATPTATTDAANKAYVDALIGASDAVVYKGVIDCSTNPNYPAADAGHLYRISVAGKIGGASGTNVEVGDTILCLTDGTASGTQAGVGANWNVIQANIDGAVVGPASAVADNVASFNGTTGKIVKDSGKALPTGTIVGTSDAQTLTSKTLTSPVLNTGVSGTAVDTDSTMAANSDTILASQKAIKTALALKANLASPALTGTPTLAGATSGTIGLVATAIAGSNTLTLPAATDTLVGRATTDTLTNKRITKRVVALADATSITPNADTTDEATLSSTQAAGNLTVNAPSGTPTEGQPLVLRLKATNAQNYAWDAIFRASSSLALPGTLAAGKTDYIGFVYNSADSKWDLLAATQGF